MSNLASRSSPTMPAAPSPQITRAIDWLLSGAANLAVGVELQPGKSLAPDERQMVMARQATLLAALDARSSHAIAEMVTKLLAGFPSARQSGGEAMAVVSAYVTTLADVPPWALEEAIRRWPVIANDRGQGLAFPPSALELLDLAQNAMKRYVVENSRITLALAAKERPISEAERERVGKGFDNLRAELSRSPTAEQLRTSAQASLRHRLVELGQDPVALDAIPDAPERTGPFRRANPPL